MGAKQPEDLLVWNLVHRLKLEVYALTARPEIQKDFRFCHQIREAAASAENNVAEGFWRYSHGDFARFLTIARASAGEVRNQLGDARDRGYLEDKECARLIALADRALAATAALHSYLRTHATPQK